MRFYIFTILFLFAKGTHAGSLPANTAVFVIPKLEGDTKTNNFNAGSLKPEGIIDRIEDAKEVVDKIEIVESEDGTTISIPVKNENGDYDLVDIEFSEDEDTRTISIPGEGDLSVIIDENGDYNIELTPEQIKESNNISCGVNSGGKSICTISPFVSIVGGKVLKADELAVDYAGSGNLTIMNGVAKNLILVDEDSKTNFNKSVVSAGDSTIGVSFYKKGDSSQGDDEVLGLLNPFNQNSKLLNSPEEFKKSNNFQISLNTSKLTKEVTNPKDRSQKATQFEVLDNKGITSTLNFSDGETTNIDMAASINGGFKYNSDPFSDTSTIIESSSPANFNFSSESGPNGEGSSLSILIEENDLNGGQSVLTILDKSEKGKTQKTTTFGQTGVLLKQTGNSNVAFEAFSKKILNEKTDDKGNTTVVNIEGPQIKGSQIGDEKNVLATAGSIDYVSQRNGVVQSELHLGGGVQYLMHENNDLKKQEALAGVAYYNNGTTDVNLSGNVFLTETTFKNIDNAPELSGKKVQKTGFASGAKGSVTHNDTVATIRDDFSYSEVNFFDGSSSMVYTGTAGGITNPDYKINFSDGLVIQTEKNKQDEFVKTQVSTTNFSGSEVDSDKKFSVLNSFTQLEKTGETDTGKDILAIYHSSNQIQVQDEKSKIRLDKTTISAVDADKIKYGTMSFDEANYVKVKGDDKVDNETVNITGLSSSFYIDETDENNIIRNASAEALGLKASGVDYSVDVLALDENGEEAKFKIILMEEGKNKSYKIFAEDGSLVHVNGQTKDLLIPQALFESLEYFESDEFKVFSAKKLSGTIEDINKDDPKIRDFNLARIDGYESINGDYKQYSIEGGEINEFDINKNQNTFLAAANIEYNEDNVLGIKSASVEGGSALQVGPDQRTELNGFNFQGTDAGEIKYGTISFDAGSRKKNLMSTGVYSDEIKFLDLTAAFYSDKTDTENEKATVDAKLEELNVKNKDMNLNLISRDKDGNQQKLSVFYNQDGDEKSYQVYADDGSLIYISHDDKDGQLTDATFKAIELFETKEFEQAAIWELEGAIETINSTDDKLTSFSIAAGNAYRHKMNGSEYADLTKIRIEQKDNLTGRVQVGSAETAQYVNDGLGNKSLIVESVNASQVDNKSSSQITGLNLNAVQNDQVKLGTISMDKFESIRPGKKDGDLDESISVIGADIAFYIDDTDKDNPYKNAIVDLGDVNVVGADYSVDVFALNENGDKEKFSIVFLEDGVNKSYKIFSGDGSLVHVKGQSKGDALPDTVFKSISYFESDKFKQLIGEEVKGELKTVTDTEDKVEKFSLARIETIESINGDYKNYLVTDGKVELEDIKAGEKSSFNFDSISFTENNTLDLKILQGELVNGVVKQVTLDDKGKTKREAFLEIGNLIGSQTEDKDGNTITNIQATNTDFLIIDHKDMKEFSGSLGKASLYEDEYVQSINLQDLENFSFKDLDSGATAAGKAKNIVRVVQKDKNGKVISSYLLIDQGALSLNDKTNALSAEIKVGVFEYLQEKLNDRNIILRADVQGKLVLDKAPVGAEVSFDLQATNITYGTNKFKSDDGSVIRNSIHIDALGAEGRIDKIQLSAGPDFLKEAVHLEAKGSESGGRSIRLSYEQDKKNGKYFLKGEFKNGEELEVKLFPFKYKGEKTKDGDGVAFSQIITPKGQNMMNHLDIVSEVVSTQELTDWLKISYGGVITARTGTLGGFAVELLYKDSENLKFQHDPEFDGMAQEAKSIGASIVRVNDRGDESAVGVLFSGDSEIDIQTTQGDFSILGIKQKDHARLPGTVNLFFKKKYADGDGFYTGVFYSLPSALIDEQMLDKNAEFYEGGRTSGKAGASLAYYKKLSPSSQLKFGAGVNNDFKDPAFCLTYTNNEINPIEDLGNGILNIVNGMPFSHKVTRPTNLRRHTASESIEIDQLKADIDELQIRYEGARVLEKVNRALVEVEKYLESSGELNQKEMKILDISVEDLESFAKLEVDPKAAISLDKIVAKVREAKLLVRSDMSDADKKRWQVINLRESMTKLAENYDQTNSIDIYSEYLDKYRKLEKLGINPKRIR